MLIDSRGWEKERLESLVLEFLIECWVGRKIFLYFSIIRRYLLFMEKKLDV